MKSQAKKHGNNLGRRSRRIKRGKVGAKLNRLQREERRIYEEAAK